MYKIKLKNGTEIKNLELNGNNFISKVKLTEEMFKDNLGKVTITGEGVTEIRTDMVLVTLAQVGEESWFIIEEKTEHQKELDKLASSMASSVTDVQLALAEVYEMVATGGLV